MILNLIDCILHLEAGLTQVKLLTKCRLSACYRPQIDDIYLQLKYIFIQFAYGQRHCKGKYKDFIQLPTFNGSELKIYFLWSQKYKLIISNLRCEF